MKGILLLNLGTPDSPSPQDVKKYLAEFLMDPWVIDIPYPARLALVYGIILNTRPKKSAEAYQKVWGDRGSPLLFHSLDLASRVQDRLYPQRKVALAMRYGNPSIASALKKLQESEVDDLLVIPLYPQYSLAATQSSIEKVKKELKKLKWQPDKLAFVESFYEDAGFIQSFRQRFAVEKKSFNADYVLFSYHGLPERHCKKTDDTGRYCLRSETCCNAIVEANKNCYRAQCFATTRELVATLGLGPSEYSVSFQSRLGRSTWIKPYTDFVLKELAAKGVKRLLVTCPSFVADCLETVEEIAIRAREDFKAAGGEDLRLVPSLNAETAWVDAVVSLIEQNQR